MVPQLEALAITQQGFSRKVVVVIIVEGLSKKYGSKLAVNNVSFTVPDGQVTGFLGPNGSGKSTTMRCMLGFVAEVRGDECSAAAITIIICRGNLK